MQLSTKQPTPPMRPVAPTAKVIDPPEPAARTVQKMDKLRPTRRDRTPRHWLANRPGATAACASENPNGIQ